MAPETDPPDGGQNRHPVAKERGDWAPAFLRALAATGIVVRACKLAKVSRSTVYQRKENDKEFRAAWDNAQDDATDKLEQEAWRRAMRGTKRPVFFKGEVCGHIREYSDSLLLALLKANRPEKYADWSRMKAAFEELFTKFREEGGNLDNL